MVFKHCTELADYYDDLVNSIIDFSVQIDPFGTMGAPKNIPFVAGAKVGKEYKTLVKDRINQFKFIHQQKPDFDGFVKKYEASKKPVEKTEE